MIGNIHFAWRVIVEAVDDWEALSESRIGESMVDPKAIAPTLFA
jgi:hypothetical protein